MGNVVDLKKKNRLIYICGECGCSSFFLYNDDTTECANCQAIDDNSSHWVTPLQDKEKKEDEDSGGALIVKAIGTVEFAQRLTVKRILERQADIELVAGWFSDGSMVGWNGAVNPNQNKINVERLEQFMKQTASISDERFLD